MKKLLAVLALLALSTLSYAKEVVSTDSAIYIVDGKKVYMCIPAGCVTISDDYTKKIKEK